MKKKILAILLPAILLFGLTQATVFANPLTWNLNNVNFQDDGTASGLFVYDADSNSVLSWSISVAGGDTTTFPPFTYGNGLPNNTGASMYPNYVLFDTDILNPDPAYPDAHRQLRLGLNAILTNAGGAVGIDANNPYAGECYNCSPWRPLRGGGSLVAQVPVPEPSTMLLLGSGLLGLVGLRRKFKK